MEKSKGLESKEKLMKIALKHFAAHGIDKAKIRDIAKDAGLAPATVIYHFKNKNKLYENVVFFSIGKNRELSKSYQDIRDNAYDKLLKYFRVNYEWGVEDIDNGTIITNLYYYATFNPEFKAIYTQVLKGARHFILEILYQGEREKIFSFSMPIEMAGEILQEFLLGSLINIGSTEGLCEGKDFTFQKWNNLITYITGYKS